MPDLLNISVSGLFAAGRALNTTSHNVANINTPGYSRQRVELATKPSAYTSGQYVGTGVNVYQVRRSYDDFLTGNLRDITSRQSQTESLYDLASKVDNLLADPMAGLSPAIDEFFAATQEVADDPTSSAARQSLLSNAETLSKRFNIQATRLNELQDYVDDQIEININEINGLTSSIAKLNYDISVSTARGVTSHALPNDLMDSREEDLRQLSEKIGVTLIKQEDGMFNVMIGSGQALVTGTQVRFLSAKKSPYDQKQNEIALGKAVNLINDPDGEANKSSTATQPIVSNQITGGALGGLLQFRREVLTPAQNGLGRVAAGMAIEFNTQHQLGIDLNNAKGKDFFNVAAPEIFANVNNKSALQLNAEITDTAALTTSDYQLTVMGVASSGINYSLTRLSDGTKTTLQASHRVNDDGSIALTLDPPVDGITFILNTEIDGQNMVGDSFLIRPTRAAADKIALAIDDPTAIAAASPVRTSAAPGNIGTAKLNLDQIINTQDLSYPWTENPPPPTLISLNENKTARGQLSYAIYDNTSSTSRESFGNLSLDKALDTTKLAISPNGKFTPILIRFDDPKTTGGELTYSVYDNSLPSDPQLMQDWSDPTNPIPLENIPYDAKQEVLMFLGEDFGYRVSLSGNPKPGDSFTIGYNTEAKGDNRNMLDLVNLQNKQLLANGTTNFQGAHNQNVSEVGVATRRAQINNDAEESLLAQAQRDQQEVAGVNLDEEAANLLKYQEAYQAAAQIVSVADELFKTILGVVAR